MGSHRQQAHRGGAHRKAQNRNFGLTYPFCYARQLSLRSGLVSLKLQRADTLYNKKRNYYQYPNKCSTNLIHVMLQIYEIRFMYSFILYNKLVTTEHGLHSSDRFRSVSPYLMHKKWVKENNRNFLKITG